MSKLWFRGSQPRIWVGFVYDWQCGKFAKRTRSWVFCL